MGSVKDLEVRRKPTEIMMGDGVFHFSDRYSVFDWGEMPDHIKNKGAALCAMSAYFFEQLGKRDIVTHYRGVSTGDRYGPLDDAKEAPAKMRVALARVIKPTAVVAEDGKVTYDYTPVRDAPGNLVIPVEAIYRNSLPKGSSVFRRLKEGTLTLGEMGLSAMPVEGQRLSAPFVDGSTKYEEFDRYPSWDDLQYLAGLSGDELTALQEAVLKGNEVITDGMSRAGFFNEDGKLEFVFTPTRTLMVGDTLGTLDECRITYNGVDVSKQIPRDWYAYSQPEWKNWIDVEKRINKKDWKSRVTTQPEPLPPALKGVMEALYVSVANRVIGRDLFPGAVPVDKILAEYQRFREAEMK
ncbi:MAG: phosphoribosylaminoimidazolesuccinocarboxamide synthase [Candidatus Aenigmatarchaeota archaeon]